jgi:hypothetical protein
VVVVRVARAVVVFLVAELLAVVRRRVVRLRAGRGGVLGADADSDMH